VVCSTERSVVGADLSGREHFRRAMQ